MVTIWVRESVISYRRETYASYNLGYLVNLGRELHLTVASSSIADSHPGNQAIGKWESFSSMLSELDLLKSFSL